MITSREPRSAQQCPTRGVRTRVAAAAAVVVAASGLGLAVAGPASAQLPGAPCLWADAAYPQGETVYAGGWAFTCATDFLGTARWNRGGIAQHRSTVDNPGAATNPAGRFSPGARQPGTAYTDYCVGDQLIEGTEDVYEAVPVGGGLYWRAAGPVSQWRFDGARPEPSWRSSSSCREGSLL
ncbi:hypothetical protein [Nocardia blacklockiae]|uniref:hypothetical protein n=1 Tax=Nocardia blacklockiae TaxID=480036 RepID=UPI0018956E1F|nr:hypothetical protein [Nocardia blacklockiae]MBF6175623.1 hypothetical protein [Nocardia blacklockiae]